MKKHTAPQARYRALIEETIRGDVAFGGAEHYLDYLQGTYVRTVADVDGLLGSGRSGRILEVGSYLGVVSVALKKLGYDVSATDLPEFYDYLRGVYDKNAIPFEAVNLRDRRLPYPDDAFDAVVMCEVLEHLNFNPLPILQEINRILKTGGYIYIGTPNQADILSRMRRIFGRSTSNPVGDFFQQLSSEQNMLVTIHWREYTRAELTEMIERMGFQCVRREFYSTMPAKSRNWKHLLAAIAYAVPSFRPSQVIVGRKRAAATYEFCFTDATS